MWANIICAAPQAPSGLGGQRCPSPSPNGRVGVTAVCPSCIHYTARCVHTYPSHVYFTTRQYIMLPNEWSSSLQQASDTEGWVSSLTFQFRSILCWTGPEWTGLGCQYELFEAYRISYIEAWLVYCLAQASNLDLPLPRLGQLMNGGWVSHKFTPSNLLSVYWHVSHRGCV